MGKQRCRPYTRSQGEKKSNDVAPHYPREDIQSFTKYDMSWCDNYYSWREESYNNYYEQRQLQFHPQSYPRKCEPYSFRNGNNHSKKRPNRVRSSNKKEQGPISKESEDTLRTRIRNETQFQEERDKERQDLVKDKVKELQRKLTTAPLDSQQNHDNPKENTDTLSASSIPLPTSNPLLPLDPSLINCTTSHQNNVPICRTSTSNSNPSHSNPPPCKRNPRRNNSSKKVSNKSSGSRCRKKDSKSSDSNKLRRNKNTVSSTLKLNITTSSDSSPSNNSRRRKRRKTFVDIVEESIPESSSSVLNYDSFKASIAKKDPKYLKELIESPTFLKKVLMTKLVEDHRKQISEKLNQLRFNDDKRISESDLNDPLSDGLDPFGQVDFKELPHDFISDITNLILSQKQSQENPQSFAPNNSESIDANDEDIMEVPVPPKTPPPFINLSDGEDHNETLDDDKERQKLFVVKLNEQIDLLDQEENHVNEMLDKLYQEKIILNARLSTISSSRKSLLLESAEYLKL
uniref:Uncharacterized protein n=1 Tax=Lepeophtheirus salmonis TaxID=72036 RepID=A0A0K2UMG7_LEPSM